MRKIDELLREVPAFAGMHPTHLELMAGCAVNRVYTPGEFLMREGERADTFFVIRRGDVSIEVFVPHRGALTIETLHEDELLGWSWLIPPYRNAFDARAMDTTHAVVFDGSCLRGKFEQDAELGYGLLSRFLPVLAERLEAARLRLIDIYGDAAVA